jgi:peroxiredoxin Q/BCP
VEAAEFTAALKKFEKLDAVVLGVSPDKTVTHRNFREKQDLKVTLLSDPEHEALEAYGAWRLKKNYGREYMGVARSTVLINPAGKVAKVWPNVKAKGHAEQVLAELKEQQG